MSHFLFPLDVTVFRWINQGWSCRPLDIFFSFVTDIHYFYPAILALAVYLLIWGGAKGRWMVLALIVTVILTDQISAHVLKNLVGRVRPCNALSGVLTPVGPSSSHSFPSSHATNMGGTMLLLSLAYPAYAWFFGFWALAAGLSRIYLGLHYPSDVLGGYLLGMVIGWGVWSGLRKWVPAFQTKTAAKAIPDQKPGTKKQKRKRLSDHG